MALPDSALPEKLKHDAILEALFEVRFESPGLLPEAVAGRLLSSQKWEGYEVIRLPEFEIPPRFREIAANLRYRPTHVLKEPNSGFSVRIGGHVLSCHVVKPYPGWANFKPLLTEACAQLQQAAPDAVASRLGLRYVNSLEKDLHGIASFADLNITAALAAEPVSDDININLYDSERDGLQSISRIATRKFVSGFPENVLLVIDIDVFQEFAEHPKLHEQDLDSWINQAHVNEKRRFFNILRPEDVERLREVRHESRIFH